MFSMVETLGRHTKVHIPSPRTWEGMDRQEMCQSVPFAMPCGYCPPHPTVPWEGLDGRGFYQSVPFAMPCTYVHPIPLYCGRDWTDEGCTKVSHLLFFIHFTYSSIQSLPRYNGMGWTVGTVQSKGDTLAQPSSVHSLPWYSGMGWRVGTGHSK